MKQRIFIPTITVDRQKVNNAIQQVQQLTEFDITKFIQVKQSKEECNVEMDHSVI